MDAPPSGTAPVRPRVVDARVPEAEPRLLADVVGDLLEAGARGTVALVGAAGSGRSTALADLAARFPGRPDLLLADDGDAPPPAAAERALAVRSAPAGAEADAAVLRLVPWGEDEWIEYLLGVHPERCAAVMRRVRASPAAWRVPDGAELWRCALDALAADEGLPDVPAALLAGLAARLGTAELLETAELLALAVLLEAEPVDPARFDELGGGALLRHARLQRLCAAERVLTDLRRAGRSSSRSEARGMPYLGGRLPPALLSEVAERHRAACAAIGRPAEAAVVAGLRRHLAGASAGHATTAEVAAVLGGRVLADALVDRPAQAPPLDLTQAGLRGARLAGCDLSGARLAWARLDGAVLDGARLRRASLSEARIDGASLRGADLSGADLHGLPLRRARLDGARFAGARMDGADLEGVELDAPCLAGASLREARLSDAHLAGADLSGADLAGAELAGVTLAGASLAGCDLTGASFHRGSTRSGLVFGEPSEGTRAGFYTDELAAAAYKPAEEIRVADLRRVDLRGARIEQCDLYLVDLRGARLDARQRAHLVRCGALLSGA